MLNTTFTGEIDHLVRGSEWTPNWGSISIGDTFSISFTYDDSAFFRTTTYSATGEVYFSGIPSHSEEHLKTFSDVDYSMNGSIADWINALPPATGGYTVQQTYVLLDSPNKRYYSIYSSRDFDLYSSYSLSIGPYQQDGSNWGVFDWYDSRGGYLDNVMISISFGTVETHPVSPIPEPSTVLLLGSGLMGLAWCGRKRKKAWTQGTL
jgi:hypothetical protein